MSGLEALTEISDSELNMEDAPLLDIDSDSDSDDFNEDENEDLVDVDSDINADLEKYTSDILDDNSQSYKDNLNIEEEEEDDDDDDDDDDDVDEKYLQKFDSNVRTQFIESYHPEVLSHNYNEIKNLSQITRDKNGVIIDNLHKTIPFLTKYEKARIIGQRANQINAGAKPLIQVAPGIIDSYTIACKELELKKMPFIIKRPIPNGGFEYWNLSDLELLD